ncbi:hypothetical protein [Kocuria nitroreducens]|uniref:hypothetical protein n=1 Tax=Kocuria nitroreducens TaxID=3058914 RepID=UPI0036D956FD
MNAPVVSSGPHLISGTAWPRPGSTVQAWRYDVLHYQGEVEDIMPGSGVLWIREHGLGVRKMIDLREYHVRLG